MKKHILSLLRYLKPPRSLRFTKLGTYMVLLTMGIGMAGMNTGNNLLYLIFGMMLGMITASGVISEISLRGLDADWIFPSEIFAGQAAKIRVILRNQKEKMPSFGIKVEFNMAEKTNSPTDPLPKIIDEASFIFIPAKSQGYFDLQFVPESRGEAVIEKLKIKTLFPFGFFQKYLVRPVGKSIVVYPKIRPIKPRELLWSRDDFRRTLPLKGWGDSYWGIRQFVEGDNPGRISWKSSAKQKRLMVRETEKDTEKKSWISMDPLEAWKNLNKDELESALSFTASFAWKQFLEGYSVGFISGQETVRPAAERKNLCRILASLALFDPDRRPEGSARAVHKHEVDDPPVEILTLWKIRDKTEWPT